MRFAILILIAWMGDALAQDRLEFEIVPVWVTDPLMQSSPSISELNDALSTLHQAMSVLGVRPNEYNLVLSEETEYLECSKATVLQAQTCSHQRLGMIDISAEGWTEFIDSIYASLPQGGHQLLILIQPDDWAWTGISGFARAWAWELDRTKHNWRTSSCRAWSINAVNYIAHELGHCFRLVHNEDDVNNYEIDLMLASPFIFDWLKGSNASIVRHHFRPVIVTPEATMLRPQVELHY